MGYLVESIKNNSSTGAVRNLQVQSRIFELLALQLDQFRQDNNSNFLNTNDRDKLHALRLYIDRPTGVDLALCERVTHHLNDLRVDYALEVSSPGDKYRRKRASSTASETKESSQ